MLAVGHRLGPYEIVAPLGAGGMGEVYEARDTRLGRTVAIKVLPSGVASSADRLARFEREARSVSKLSHPHVCTLHDVGEEDGIHFLVMEHCEGETLAERLGRGPLPLPEVLRYGAQIAEALDAAHRRNIVHRDLKPANIMLTSSGAKLLDFGLARMAAGDEQNDQSRLGEMATLARDPDQPLTAEGTILGTYPYMAPEQVEGAETDARSDIFSLGAVLYEMVTGQRAFQGKSAASVMAAVLKEEPQPLSKVQSVAPPALDHVVSRCLAKDPEDRWQSAKDVAVELRWIGEAGSQAGVAAPVAKRRKSRERLAWALFAAAVLFAVMLGLAWRAEPQPEFLVTRSLVSLPEEFTTGESTGGTVSPDGRAMVVALFRQGTRQLFVRDLNSLEIRALKGTEGAYEPFFSPDGEWIGYLHDDELKKIPARGGASLTIASLPKGFFGGAGWSDDGTIVFSRIGEGLWKVSAAGGEPEEVHVDSEDELLFFGPHFLPGRRIFLATVGRVQDLGPESARVVAIDLDTGELKPLLPGLWHSFLPPGYLLFKSPEDILMVAPFDPDRLEVTGEPLAALEEDRVVWYGVSRNGMLVYDAPGLDVDLVGELVWIDADGEEVETLGLPSADFNTMMIAPDGRRIAVSIVRRGAPARLHLVDLDRAAVVPLPEPPGAGAAVNPIWSPDGGTIVFTHWGDTPGGSLYRLSPGAGGPELLLEESGQTLVAEDWSPDGGTILLEVHPADASAAADLFTVTLEGEPKLQRLLATSAHEETARFSPDGRFVAFTSNSTGREEVYVAPYPAMDRRWQVSLTGGVHPRWSPGSDRILYRQGDRVLAVTVATDGEISIGRPAMIVQGNYSGARNPSRGGAWDVAPDGRLLMVRLPERGQHYMVLVNNWHLEVEELMSGAGKR